MNLIANIPIVIGNAGQWGANTGIDLVIPGECVGGIVETRLAEIQGKPPFSTVTELVDKLTPGAVGSVSLGAIDLPGGGSVALPMAMVNSSPPLVRSVLSAIVWLTCAITCFKIVTGSLGVRGSGE
jgi:hypothetical protein